MKKFLVMVILLAFLCIPIIANNTYKIKGIISYCEYTKIKSQSIIIGEVDGKLIIEINGEFFIVDSK